MLVLDANIIIELERGNTRVTGELEKLREKHPGNIAVSSPAYAEAYYGLLAAAREMPDNAFANLEKFEVLAFDKQSAQVFSRLKLQLEKAGQMIPLLDLLISAIVIQAGAVLFSSDEHFKKVPGLKLVLLRT